MDEHLEFFPTTFPSVPECFLAPLWFALSLPLESHCFQARSISRSSNVAAVHFLSLEFHHFGSLRKVIDTVNVTFPLVFLHSPGCSPPLHLHPPYLSPTQKATPHVCSLFGTLFVSCAHLLTLTSCFFLSPSQQWISSIT